MSCLFLSISDRAPLWSLTFPNIASYCEKYGFVFHKLHHSLDESRHISWSKIPFLIDQMNQHPEYDFYIWIDDDMLITNFDINVENVVKQYDFHSLLVSQDPFKKNYNDDFPFNCGLMVFKKNKCTSMLFEKIYSMDKECGTTWQHNWEQDAFIKYYKYYMSNKKIIVTAPYRTLQSYYRHELYKDSSWQKGDFVAHFSGLSLENRLEYLKTVINDVK